MIEYVILMIAVAVCAYALLRPRVGVFANSTGTHGGHITRLADAAHTARHLLVAVGSDASHVAVVGSGIPLGVCTDTPSAAGDAVNVALLGCAQSTLQMVASASVTAGTELVAQASGKAGPTPVLPGTYYKVGIALTDAAQDALVEVDPRPATPVVVGE